MMQTKKLIVAVLAVVTAVALCVPALAFADGETYEGKITISTINGQTYDLYKLFDATVVDGRTADATDGISYTLMEDKTDLGTNGGTWFELKNGNVVAKANADITTDAFKTWAESYGAKNTTTITGDGSAQSWTGLTAGYYYITTTTGSLVTVTSITPDVTVKDKNVAPTIEKDIIKVTNGTVAEDGETAHGQVGDTVDYNVAINAYKGAEAYELKDTLSTGLTLVNTATTSGDATTNSGIVVKVGDTTLAENKDYTVTIDGQNITVTFQKSYLDKIGGTAANPTVINVSYSAIINVNAVVGAGGNNNRAKLEYGHAPTGGNKPSTTVDDPKVYVASITINKVKPGETADTTAPLEGAGFKVYKMVGEAKKYYVNTDGVISWADTEAAGTEVPASAGDGKNTATFSGLADGTYYIVESTVPKGYNKVTDGQYSFTVTAGTYDNANLIQAKDILNQSGAVLPSTGGIGTTIFYVVGAVLVIGAVVVLITKRRARKEEEDEQV